MIFLKLLKDKNNEELQLLLWHLIHESAIFKSLTINGRHSYLNKNLIKNILKTYYIETNKRTENEIPSLINKKYRFTNWRTSLSVLFQEQFA